MICAYKTSLDHICLQGPYGIKAMGEIHHTTILTRRQTISAPWLSFLGPALQPMLLEEIITRMLTLALPGLLHRLTTNSHTRSSLHMMMSMPTLLEAHVALLDPRGRTLHQSLSGVSTRAGTLLLPFPTSTAPLVGQFSSSARI